MTVNGSVQNNTLTIALGGRIDSVNAAQVEAAINEVLQAHSEDDTVLDLQELEYISSAGLRVLLRIRKERPGLRLTNVSRDVYDIFEMTGFTEMMPVSRAFRVLSVEGCEVIGQGSNGVVYRIDPETIVKVYRDPDALPDIRRERELAKKAFVLGIPTAIPYDVVRVGDSYGSVFELLSADSLSKLIAAEPENIDKYIDIYTELLKKIHGTELSPGDMPDMKAVALNWAAFLEGHLPADAHAKLVRLIEAVPEDHHMVHGDYHTKNVMLQDGEVLLIDMDTLCMGHPVFEFASIYNAYIGFSELDHSVSPSFLGISHEAAVYIWEETVKRYFAGRSEEELELIKKKAMLIGQMRILRRTIRRGGGKPEAQAQIETSRAHILELLPEIETLEL